MENLLFIERVNFVVKATLEKKCDFNNKFCYVILSNGQQQKFDLAMNPFWRFVRKNELVYKTSEGLLVPLFIDKSSKDVPKIKKYLEKHNILKLSSYHKAGYTYKRLKVLRVIFDDEISLVGNATRLETRVYALVKNYPQFFPMLVEHKADEDYWVNIEEGDFIIHIPEIYGFFPLIKGISEKNEKELVNNLKNGKLYELIADIND